MFNRKIEKKLYEYYKDDESRILMITGARQIGKSFIVRETAREYYKNYIEINLQLDYLNNKFFENVKSIQSFYLQVTSMYGDQIGNYNDTIIFLDEIQFYPNLITLLKPLKEDKRFKIIASGSLLGIELKHIFIPIGYVEEYKMYPMDFEEFLLAYNVHKDVIAYLKDCFINLQPVEDGIHKIILEKFKEYLLCGGLPDSVSKYLIDKNVMLTRNIQNQIYEYYKDDASKYEKEKCLKIKTIYDSLPSYMESKVKRLNFKSIENIRNANLSKYQDEFDYLIYSGTTIPVKAVSNPKFPLIESSSKNLIKLYFNDVGILSNILYKNNINALLYTDVAVNLGSVYETVCAMELLAHGHDLYYFDSKKVGEVDFLINNYDELSIVPIEIKSGNDQHNYRALPKLVKEPYNLKKGLIFGNKNIVKQEDSIITYPIYMIMFV